MESPEVASRWMATNKHKNKRFVGLWGYEITGARIRPKDQGPEGIIDDKPPKVIRSLAEKTWTCSCLGSLPQCFGIISRVKA